MTQIGPEVRIAAISIARRQLPRLCGLQGFPAASKGLAARRAILRLSLLFSSLLFGISVLGQFSQQGPKILAADSVGTPVDFGSSVCLSSDGNTAIVGGPHDNGNVGAAWIFERSGGTWIQQGPKLVGTGYVGAPQQGWAASLSADGNTAIIGGPGDQGGAGAAWIFKRSGSTWTQQGSKLVGTGGDTAAQQGFSVSLSADGNTAIVGGPGDNSTAGAAWVFTRIGSTWTQQGGKLVGSGASTLWGWAQQGRAVALSADGNTAIVGGPFDNQKQYGWADGAAWVFTRSEPNWTQQGNKLIGLDSINANQGYSVSLSADGNTAIIGGPTNGGVWVWTRTGSDWSQQGAKLVGSDATGTFGSQQGYAVSLSADGNTAIAGGPGDQGGAGAAWVFTRTGSTWTQQGSKLVGTSGDTAAQQGHSVSLSADGNTAIVGGPINDNSFGAAWVFVRTSCTLTCTPTVPSTGGVNQQVTFSATATPIGCGGTPTFDWDFGDGTAHGSGATVTHTFASAGIKTWTLTVTLSGASPCVQTGTITISDVCTAPSITTPPQSTTITSGESATLSVTPSPSTTPPVHYTWYRGTSGDTSAPVGSDSSSFNTGPLTQTTSYWVEVMNPCGTANSATATVTVTRSLTLTASDVVVTNTTKNANQFDLYMKVQDDQSHYILPSGYQAQLQGSQDSQQIAFAPDSVTADSVTNVWHMTFTLPPASNGAPWIENALLKVTRTADLSSCMLPSNVINISAYGTTFQMDRDAYRFANGAWSKDLAGSTMGLSEPVIKAAETVAEDLSFMDTADFWESVGWDPVHYRRAAKSRGLCYGMALSGVANFSHASGNRWGESCPNGADYCPWHSSLDNSFQAAIDARWSGSSPPAGSNKPLDGACWGNGSSMSWNLEAAKKIMYYFVTQRGYSGAFLHPSPWVGGDRYRSLTGTADLREHFLKKNVPIPLAVTMPTLGGHTVVITQLLMNNAMNQLSIYDNAHPTINSNGQLQDWFLAIRFNRDSQLTDMKGLELAAAIHCPGYSLFWFPIWPSVSSGLILDPAHDSQKVYGDTPLTQASAAFDRVAEDSRVEGPSVDSQAYLEVTLVGASSFQVTDAATGLAVPLTADDDLDGVHNTAYQDDRGILSVLHLLNQAGKAYRIAATKTASFPRLKVYVTVPQDDGTARFLGYDNAQLSLYDATGVTFLVGKDNADFDLQRSLNGAPADTLQPTFNEVDPTAVPPVSLASISLNGLNAVLRWTNPTHPLFKDVLVVRKADSPPTSSTDGLLVCSGTDETFTDGPLASGLYFYALFARDTSDAVTDPALLSLDTTLGCISGLVTLAPGSPISDASLSLAGPGGVALGTASDGEGRYDFPNLPSGTYQLTCTAEGYTFPASPASVTVGSICVEADLQGTSQPSARMISPNGGESYYGGDQKFVSWTSSHLSGTVTLDLSTDGGTTWNLVVAGQPAVGSYPWTVPNLDSAQCLMRVSGAGGSISDSSDAVFTIARACSLSCDATVPGSGTAGVPVYFQASAGATGCSSTVAYDWDFGDSSSHSSDQNPTHTYAAEGTYTWTLAVFAGGQACSKTGSIDVSTGLPTDLLAYWSFNDGTGADNSGNGHDATPQGSVAIKTGECGNGAELTGGYYEAQPINLDTSLTVSAWVYPYTVDSSSAQTVLFERQPNGWDGACGGASAGNYGLQLYTGQFSFEVATTDEVGNCQNTRVKAGSPQPNLWYFLTGTYDKTSGTVAVYANGVKLNQAVGYSHLRTQPTGVTIRIGKNTSIQPWNGLVDEVRIYGHAFTDTEVGELYASACVEHCTLDCTADVPSSGSLGASISFAGSATTSNCTGTPTYDWDFGDGSVHSSQQSPHYAYTTPGTYTWGFRASIGSVTCTKSGTINIACPTITISPSSVPSGTAGTGYPSTSFTQTGAVGMITWSESGTLPTGMTFFSGTLAGTPTQAGDFPFTVTATGANGCAGSRTCTLSITCPALTLIPTTLPGAGVGASYWQTITASGGTAPYLFSVMDGALPGGLSLSASGVLFGTFSAPGDFSFTVKAKDTNGCAGMATYSIHVVPPPVVSLKKVAPPFKIVVTGSNLQNGIKVTIDGNEWTSVVWKNDTKILITGGKALKTAVPKSTAHAFRFVNPDGGEATVAWGWPSW